MSIAAAQKRQPLLVEVEALVYTVVVRVVVVVVLVVGHLRRLLPLLEPGQRSLERGVTVD